MHWRSAERTQNCDCNVSTSHRLLPLHKRPDD
jgi:hypothetical protein